MFKIVNITNHFEPSIKAEPALGVLEHWNSQNLRLNSPHRLFILEGVWANEIGEHLGWGKRTRQNRVEQGGILLGEVFHDPQNARTFGIVQKAVAGISAQGSPGYLSMGHNTWEEMLNQADAFLERTKNPLRIIGWYHSHPNELPVFMSGTDLNTQAKFFYNEWQFSVVINPHKQIWRAFVGRNAPECEGLIATDQSFLDWKEMAEETIENMLDFDTSTTKEEVDSKTVTETEEVIDNSITLTIPTRHDRD